MPQMNRKITFYGILTFGAGGGEIVQSAPQPFNTVRETVRRVCKI
jgi:hypothetical protein